MTIAARAIKRVDPRAFVLAGATNPRFEAWSRAVISSGVLDAVDVLADVFKLTDEERKRLSNFPVGQGLFFAGSNHVHIQVVASRTEHQLVTTNPVQQLQQEEQRRMEEMARQREQTERAAREAEGAQV